MDGHISANRTRNMPGAVIGFIRAYRARHHGEPPSLGEIATAVDSTKPRVRRLMQRLDREGALVWVPGPPRRKRAIILPDEKDRAIALLRQIGFTVNEDIHGAK